MLAVSQRLFTVDEYHAMGEAGVFTEDDRVELIDGLIIAMSPIGGPHLHSVNRLAYLFGRRLYRSEEAPLAIVSVQNSVRLNSRSEPQPDIALLRPDIDTDRLPRPADVLLLIEVSDTTLDFDLEAKVPRYAAAGIPEVWVMDLRGEVVHVFRQPGYGGYAIQNEFTRGDQLDVELLPALDRIPVSELLG